VNYSSDPRYDSPQASYEAAPRRKSRRGLWGALATGGLFLLSKAKFLLVFLKAAKFGSILSMLVTVWVYALFFGWPFAVGFVALIFVHESGHAVAMRQQGIPAGAPVYIPFVGAFIAMKGRPRDAFVEAIVGIGGPLLGTLGAIGCLVAGLLADSPLLMALASVGFLLNLFNMIPISPLDGGRIAGAISRWFWAVGYAVGIGVFMLTYSPILAIILLLGLFTIWRTVRNPVPGYYDIPAWKRVAVGAAYFGSLAVMALGMTYADGMVAPFMDSQQSAVLYGGVALHSLGVLFESRSG
jgi:Zn-dependent protease